MTYEQAEQRRQEIIESCIYGQIDIESTDIGFKGDKICIDAYDQSGKGWITLECYQAD